MAKRSDLDLSTGESHHGIFDASNNDREPASKKRRFKKRQLQEESRSQEAEDEGPACNSCRRRKTKCSREQPCLQCVRLNLDCMYDEGKERPGIRIGAVEALSQRLTTLEQMFLGQGILLEPLLKLAGKQSPGETGPNLTLQERSEKLKNEYFRAAQPTLSSTPSQQARTGSLLPSSLSTKPQQNNDHCVAISPSSGQLPPLVTLRRLVDLYFEQIHPWIPILHMSLFKEKFEDDQQRYGLTTILQGIVSICLRFDNISHLTEAEKEKWSLDCRNSVILRGMDKFSVENLQALVIVAFDIIGSGKGPSAWSIVGSMTRTVEQLQLSTEDGEDLPGQEASEFMIQRMRFLRRSDSWIESEERRRVFWNVFLMDRLCSVATGFVGWNNSLTGADVRRRLPCEGAIWQAGTQVKTPRFGIAVRSKPSPSPHTPTSERHTGEDEEIESIGGFAFCIEASESLNLVTRFFLQHAVKFDDPQEVQMWLVKFKELDLRLIKGRWRLYLPPKWRNASVLNQDGIMDPNLTLAHITQNTAVIQLHQSIAYPCAQWLENGIKLPSAGSSETCLTAASEIGIISQQYLAQSTSITNPQFSFCLFIAGRVLLAHASYYGTPLHPSLEIIITSLKEIASRWAGTSFQESEPLGNLASKFGKRLEEAQRAVTENETSRGGPLTIDIQQPVYSEHNDHLSQWTSHNPQPGSIAEQLHGQSSAESIGQQQFMPETHMYSPDSISLAFPPLPDAFEQRQRYIPQDQSRNFIGSNTSIPFALQLPYNPPINQPETQAPVFVDHEIEMLNGLYDDQYEQMIRVSMFAEDH